MKFIKKENPSLRERLQTIILNRIGEIKRRIHDGDPSELDDWPDDKWFGLTNDGVPKANWPNVYFAVKRCKITITYDEWTDEHIIQFKDAPPRSVKFEDMLPFLFEQFFNSFKFVPKEEQVKIALKIISQKPKNRTNSLLTAYSQYESLSSGDYDTDLSRTLAFKSGAARMAHTSGRWCVLYSLAMCSAPTILAASCKG
jgi:hypothetical protein